MISKLSLCADVLTILFFTLGIGYAIYEMIQERNQPEDAPVHSVRAIGRTDKNGRPVYEGDVIVYEIVFSEEENIREKSEIVWDDEVCAFMCQDINDPKNRFEIPPQADFDQDIEVIANRWGSIETWGTGR